MGDFLVWARRKGNHTYIWNLNRIGLSDKFDRVAATALSQVVDQPVPLTHGLLLPHTPTRPPDSRLPSLRHLGASADRCLGDGNLGDVAATLQHDGQHGKSSQDTPQARHRLSGGEVGGPQIGLWELGPQIGLWALGPQIGL